MSRRREIAQHRRSLADIAGIMSAMKGLALMETRVLHELIDPQLRLVAAIESCAARFLTWHGELLAPRDTCDTDAAAAEIWIVVGSEQGFCRDFNETLLAQLVHQTRLLAEAAGRVVPVLIGRRLAERGLSGASLALPGASVSNEVPSVLLRLTRELQGLLTDAPTRGAGVRVLYHCDASARIRLRQLLPFADLPAPPPAPYPPRLNLGAGDFLAELTGHYLYAVLNEVLYSSLLAENRLRLVHMDSALKKLDDDSTRLQLAYNAQRQADIVEEIELVMLCAPPGRSARRVGEGRAAQPDLPAQAADDMPLA